MPGTLDSPLAASSLWNTRRGAGAVLVHAGIAQPSLIAWEEDIIITTTTEDPVELWDSDGGWGGDRCEVVSERGDYALPIPANFYVVDEPFTTPNNSAAVVLADGETVVEFQPFQRCPADYDAEVLADNPAGYWKFDEVSGTVAVDSSGNGHDGTYNNSPTLGGATAGVTLQRTSSQDISVPDHADFDVGDTYTIEAWVRRDDLFAVGSYQTVFTKGTGGPGLQFRDNNAPYSVRSNQALYAHGTAITDAVYHHVVVVKSGATRQVWIDGADATVLDATGTTVNTALALRWGSDVGGAGGQYFDGSLKRCAFYPTALSGARIATHYNAGVGGAEPATMWSGSNVYEYNALTATNPLGSHGGSQLPALPGTIRVGELVPGGRITHAMKVLLEGRSLSPLNGGEPDSDAGFRWPATIADTGFETLYTGSVVACRMGSLLTLPDDFQIPASWPEPARILALAFQEYGAYVCDLRAGEPQFAGFGIAIERGPAGRVGEDFVSTWGYELAPDDTNDPDEPMAEAWRTIIANLHVVNNNTPTNIGGGGATPGSIFLNDPARDAVQRTYVGGVLVDNVKGVEWTYGIAQVPTATFTVRGIPTANIAFGQPVRIEAGFNQTAVRVFTGRVFHINPSLTETRIECLGYSYWLDVNFHDIVVTFDNVEVADAITDFLELSGVPDYSVDVPAWTIGTVDLAPDSEEEADKHPTLEFMTYGEAILKLGEPSRSRWMEMPSGSIIVRPLPPIASATAWRTYWTGKLAGLTNSRPTGVTFGEPQIRSLRVEQQIREVKNRVVVTGVTVTQINPDGSPSPIEIVGEAQGGSPWVRAYNNSQEYNTEAIFHELIDTPALAAAFAQNEVNVRNRLNDKLTVTIDADVEVFLGRTVRIVDEDYSRQVANFFVEGYTTVLDAEAATFNTTLNLIGGASAGTTTDVLPFALFTYTVEREVIGDRLWAVITFDGSNSFDLDGEIVSWEWSGDVTGSGRIFTTRVDPTEITPPMQVTLTVTDNSGVSDSITLEVRLEEGDEFVFIPALFVANGGYFSASPDGGVTWNDQPASAEVLAAGAHPADGIVFGVGVYGDEDGALWRTADFCATPLTLVMAAVGSPITDIEGNPWVPGEWWATTFDGRVFRSLDDGITWFLHDNLRVKLGKPALVLTGGIGLPFVGGVWFNGGDGEGRPLIAFDPNKDHNYGQANLGGELLIDILSNPVDTSLRIVAAQDQGAGFSFILNCDTFPTAVYYTENVLNDGSTWKRAVGLPGNNKGRWLIEDTGAFGAGQYSFGFDDQAVYNGDILSGVMNVTPAAGVLEGDDVANHGLSIGQYIFGITGATIVAAEGSVDGSLYKSWDRFATEPNIEKLRDADGFPANPAGANAKMVAVSSAGVPAVVPPAAAALYAMSADGQLAVFDPDTISWSLRGDVAGGPGDAYRLCVLPSGNILVIHGRAGAISASSGLYLSTDGGFTWTRKLDGSQSGDGDNYRICDLDVAPSGRIWAVRAISDVPSDDSQPNFPQEFWYSDDDGVTWELAHTDAGWTGGSVTNGATMSVGMAVNPEDGDEVVSVGHLSTTNAPRAVYTLNDGASFSRRTTGDPASNSPGAPSRDVLRFGAGGRLLWNRLIASDGGVYVSDDRGDNWVQITLPGGANDGGAIGWRHADWGDRNFALSLNVGGVDSTVLYKTEDNGDTWELVYDFGADSVGVDQQAIEYDAANDILYVMAQFLSPSQAKVFRLTNVFGAFDPDTDVEEITGNLAVLWNAAGEDDGGYNCLALPRVLAVV